MVKIKSKKEITDWEILKSIENQVLSDQLYKTIIKNKFENVGNWFDFGDKCNINNSLLNDIDMVECHEDDNTILNKTNKCITPFGLEFTKKILENPTDNIKILKSRQKNIKLLLENEDLYKNLKEKLTDIKSDYKNVLWFLNNHDEEVLQFFQKLYFENKQLQFANKNTFILSSLNYINLFIYPFMNIIYPLSSILFPYYYLKQQGHPVTMKNVINILKLLIKQMFSSSRQLIILVFSIGCYFYNAFKTFQNSYKCYKITMIVKSKLQSMMNFIQSSNQLIHSLNIPFYHENMVKDFDSLKHLIICNDVTKSILNPSCFESNGQLLKYFHDIVHNNDDIQKPISNILQYIGYIDHLYSVVTLLKTQNYSFPNYKQANRPYIRCRNLWHPCLDHEKMVYNSIDMNKNIILTGPNAGGKSTFIKNILLNITLSQSIGISNSQYFEYTPFHLIYTHINVPDNKGKESLFEAEVNRISSYIRNTIELKNDQLGIGVFDEILTSTNIEEGVSVAKSMCEEFNSMKRSLSIITTHFDSLTELKLDRFENYKVVIKRNDDDDIIFLYKVVKGVSNQKIAIELLRKKGFDSNIIEKAIKYKNQANMKPH